MRWEPIQNVWKIEMRWLGDLQAMEDDFEALSEADRLSALGEIDSIDLDCAGELQRDDAFSLISDEHHSESAHGSEAVDRGLAVVVPEDGEIENFGAGEMNSPQPVVIGAAWEHLMSQSFFSAVNTTEALCLPWETGPMKDIFNPTALPSSLSVNGDSTNLRELKPETPVPVVGHSGGDFDGSAMPAYMSAVKKMKDTDYMEDKRARTSLAVAKWMDILSVCWSCSSVGMQLKLDLQLDPTGFDAEATLRSVFGVKSPTTLLKRAASMNQYMRWFSRSSRNLVTYRSPLPFQETEVWTYFLHLRDSRKVSGKGFTISSTFLETVRFCKHIIGMDACDAILASKRLIGFAALERQQKGPTKQAPPMEVEHLLALHNILANGENKIDRIGAGCFLVATYARARWSDLRFIHHIKYDGFKRNATFDLYTAEHKTSSVGLRRQQFLPLVVPAEGVGGGDWLGTWIKLMQDNGCDWDRVPFGPLLPAPKNDEEWCARPLSTSEAATWLRKLLEGLPRCDEIKAHSMKATLCVWIARAGFSKEHRAILSHHSSALHGSDVVYSRDLQTGAIRRLQMLLRKIRLGLSESSELNEEQKKITSAFDSGLGSSIRTPVLRDASPEKMGVAKDVSGAETFQRDIQVGKALEVIDAELPCVEAGNAALDGKMSVKGEDDFEDICKSESANFGMFSVTDLSGGLIEIDSSSGSSSEPEDNSSIDSGPDDELLGEIKDRAFVVSVPNGEAFYSHKKSGILHRLIGGASSFVCKLKPGCNHVKTASTFYFKYPKCTKCFSERHKSSSPFLDTSGFLDRASKKSKAP